jgi:protein-tyrosine phosphatase
MKPTLFQIPRPGPGQLATMARPRGGEWLTDELRALRHAGVDVLVCALTDPELLELDLTDEQAASHAAALEFIAIPIHDRGVPTLAAAQPILDLLGEHLAAGHHVVIHCRNGIGRSSLLAAALLLREGLTPVQAWERISTARGLPVPDTDQQRAWLDQLARQPPNP